MQKINIGDVVMVHDFSYMTQIKSADSIQPGVSVGYGSAPWNGRDDRVQLTVFKTNCIFPADGSFSNMNLDLVIGDDGKYFRTSSKFVDVTYRTPVGQSLSGMRPKKENDDIDMMMLLTR